MTTTEPQTPPDLLETILKRAPEHLRESLRAVAEDTTPVEAPSGRETPEEAAERIAKATAVRRASWDARCPSRFRGSTVADLATEPGMADGRVAGWLDSGHRGLVIHSGITGNGKTHAAYAVGNAAVDRGLWVVAYTSAELATALQPSRDDAETVESTVHRCDLLIIDDLGREKASDWRMEVFQTLLDVRWREGRRLIVTTNMSGPDSRIIERYGDPIVDRITDDAVSVCFTGQGRRQHVPW